MIRSTTFLDGVALQAAASSVNRLGTIAMEGARLAMVQALVALQSLPLGTFGGCKGSLSLSYRPCPGCLVPKRNGGRGWSWHLAIWDQARQVVTRPSTPVKG